MLIELEWFAVVEHRPDKRDHEQEDQQREPEHELLVTEGEVERLAAPARRGSAHRGDDGAGDDGLGLGLSGVHLRPLESCAGARVDDHVGDVDDEVGDQDPDDDEQEDPREQE